MRCGIDRLRRRCGCDGQRCCMTSPSRAPNGTWPARGGRSGSRAAHRGRRRQRRHRATAAGVLAGRRHRSCHGAFRAGGRVPRHRRHVRPGPTAQRREGTPPGVARAGRSLARRRAVLCRDFGFVGGPRKLAGPHSNAGSGAGPQRRARRAVRRVHVGGTVCGAARRAALGVCVCVCVCVAAARTPTHGTAHRSQTESLCPALHLQGYAQRSREGAEASVLLRISPCPRPRSQRRAHPGSTRRGFPWASRCRCWSRCPGAGIRPASCRHCSPARGSSHRSPRNR